MFQGPPIFSQEAEIVGVWEKKVIWRTLFVRKVSFQPIWIQGMLTFFVDSGNFIGAIWYFVCEICFVEFALCKFLCQDAVNLLSFD